MTQDEISYIESSVQWARDLIAAGPLTRWFLLVADYRGYCAACEYKPNYDELACWWHCRGQFLY